MPVPEFRRHRDAEARVASARKALRAIARLDLYPAHKRELLSVCVWKLSQAEGRGKYATCFRSRQSLGASRGELRHDHVFERRKLIEALLKDPARCDEIAALAVGCTVTRAEHGRLSALSRAHPELDGWERYRAARIVVVDTATGKLLWTRGLTTG